jgi:hypothetical protein
MQFRQFYRHTASLSVSKGWAQKVNSVSGLQYFSYNEANNYCGPFKGRF